MNKRIKCLQLFVFQSTVLLNKRYLFHSSFVILELRQFVVRALNFHSNGFAEVFASFTFIRLF